MRFGITRLPRR